ncbi:SDR family NAD(P)-dependent oxidoreductase [Chloroflexota bacterium]
MGNKLKNKVAVVTGSGQGIGRAIAIALAGEGAKVVTNNRLPGTPGGDAETTAKLITDMGLQAVPFFGDVSDFEVANKLIERAVESFGRLDILVNNAGVLRDRMIFNMTPEEWDTVIKGHLYGTFNCTKPASIIMKQQRSGRIINLSTTPAINGAAHAGQSNYGAAKSGIAVFSRTIAIELGKYGVTCNVILPQASTRMTMSPEMEEARRRRIERGEVTPEQAAAWRPPPDPDYVSPIVVYLCTNEAANINGCLFGARNGDIILNTVLVSTKTIHKEGIWTLDELIDIMPRTLGAGLINPSSAEREQKT